MCSTNIFTIQKKIAQCYVRQRIRHSISIRDFHFHFGSGPLSFTFGNIHILKHMRCHNCTHYTLPTYTFMVSIAKLDLCESLKLRCQRGVFSNATCVLQRKFERFKQSWASAETTLGWPLTPQSS